jgi:FkbM family methyltransferase
MRDGGYFVRKLDLTSLRDAGKVFGIWKAILLRCGEWFSRITRTLRVKYRHPVVAVRIKGYQQPAYIRLGSSDAYVLEQIFFQCEYSPLGATIPQPMTMVDCGANIGLSALYFLHRYPDLKVIVVEPDPQNMRMCKRNLAPFAERTSFVQAGVWSRPAGLLLSGSGWGVKVREANPGEAPAVQGIDILSLLRMTPDGEIGLLKVDIEWSEIVVFGNGSEAWLPSVRNIAIELHDDQCRAVFEKALSSYRYIPSKCGELTFCLDIQSRLEPDVRQGPPLEVI